MSKNPITAYISELIHARTQGISEHELIMALDREYDAFNSTAFENAGNDSLLLFRKHFLVMNALYELQAKLINNGQYLSVSPLEIRLCPASETDDASMMAGNADQKLREYYSDLENLQSTGKAEVDDMLDRFWQRYIAHDKRYEALQTLGLTGSADLHKVKQTYRRLANEHHPDKGGDTGQFRAIREAYETLVQSGLK